MVRGCHILVLRILRLRRYQRHAATERMYLHQKRDRHICRVWVGSQEHAHRVNRLRCRCLRRADHRRADGFRAGHQPQSGAHESLQRRRAGRSDPALGVYDHRKSTARLWPTRSGSRCAGGRFVCDRLTSRLLRCEHRHPGVYGLSSDAISRGPLHRRRCGAGRAVLSRSRLRGADRERGDPHQHRIQSDG